MDKRKLVLYIATSLDGYIATKEESLEWLFSVEGEGDNGYSEFYDTVDTILIGRVTYDWIMKQENGNFPYKGKECYVFSRTKKEDNEYVHFVNDNVIELTRKLKQTDGKKIWIVGGGNLLHTFLQEDLVDELIINIAPVLIGKGIPLFIEKEQQTALSLKSMQRFGQFTELSYQVKR